MPSFPLIPNSMQSCTGGSIFVHTFGAYFGLAISFCLRKQRTEMSEEREGPRYTSDITSLLGEMIDLTASMIMHVCMYIIRVLS